MVERCLERLSEGAFALRIQVQPGAKRTKLGPVDGWRGRIKIAVTEPARAGAANDAVRKAIAEVLGIEQASIRIASGAKDHRKRIVVEGVDADMAVSLLNDTMETVA